MWDQNQLRGCNKAGVYASISQKIATSHPSWNVSQLLLRQEHLSLKCLGWSDDPLTWCSGFLCCFFFRFVFKESLKIVMLTSTLVFCLYRSSPGSEKHTQASAQCDFTVSPGCQPAKPGFSDWLFSAHSTHGYRSRCLWRYNHHPLSCKNT